MVGTCEEDSWGTVADWLIDSCMLGGRFCTESTCVPEAIEDVRVCCWLSLGDEAEQRETRSSVQCAHCMHEAAYKCCQQECHRAVRWRKQDATGQQTRRQWRHRVSECRSDVSERPGMELGLGTQSNTPSYDPRYALLAYAGCSWCQVLF